MLSREYYAKHKQQGGRALLVCTLAPTMVWPFGPSASFQAIVSTKRAQRDDAIKAQVAALQAGDHLTAEEVVITSKSGKPPDKLAGLTYATNGVRSGDRQIHTRPRVYFDPDPQSVHQVRSRRS